MTGAAPGVWPDADTMAAAIVAACERTGEDPLTVYARPRGGARMASIAVLDALHKAYPAIPWKAAGRLAGLTWKTPQQSLIQERPKTWWTRVGVMASQAALIELRDERNPAPLAEAPAPSIAYAAIPQALTDRIMNCLKQAPHTSSALATRLDVKELRVIEALNCLAHAGQVSLDDPPAEGRRFQLWRVKQSEAA